MRKFFLEVACVISMFLFFEPTPMRELRGIAFRPLPLPRDVLPALPTCFLEVALEIETSLISSALSLPGEEKPKLCSEKLGNGQERELLFQSVLYTFSPSNYSSSRLVGRRISVSQNHTFFNMYLHIL